MTLARRLALVAGVALSGCGIVAVVVPETVPQFDAATYLVAGVGLVAVAAGAAAAFVRFDADGDRLPLPARDEPPVVPVPGDDFARRLRAAGRDAEDLRESFRETAVATLSRHEGQSPSDVHARLDDGSWTADRAVAALFAGESPSTSEHLRSIVTGEPPIRRRIHLAVDALHSAVVGDEPVGDEPAGDGSSSEKSPGDAPAEAAVDPESLPVDAAADWPAVGNSVVRRTTRWRGVRALALLLVAAGALMRRPGLFLVAGVAVAFVAYDRIADPPPVALDAHRTVSAADPDPGEAVTVDVRLRNVGDRLLPDVRLVDGVPPGLRVSDGSPRFTTALRPGASASFSYTVTAERGRHEFDGPFVRARDYLGATERLARAEIDGKAVVTCVPSLPPGVPVPLRDAVTRVVGRGAATPASGGVEFDSLREYRRGDPVARVDWARLARTGDLATLAVREPHAASVVVAIDARAAAYVAPEPSAPPAVERCVDGAGAIVASLLDGGHRVGVAALSPRTCWVAPGTGVTHRARLADRLATDPAFARDPPRKGAAIDIADRLRGRLSGDVQVLALSPLADDAAVSLLRRIEAAGTPVSVVSPDPTSVDGAAHRLGRLERRLRVVDLRRAGIPVHDWPWDAPFERAAAGWSP